MTKTRVWIYEVRKNGQSHYKSLAGSGPGLGTFLLKIRHQALGLSYLLPSLSLESFHSHVDTNTEAGAT